MFKKRWLLVFTVLVLLVLLVPACGGGDEEPISSPTTTPIVTATPTSTSTSIATPTAMPTAAPTITPTSTGPVKLGGICPWSGAAAVSGTGMADPMIKLTEWQVKQEGGILGGRDLKIVRYDNRGSVAEAVAGARKVMDDDKVSALLWGGVSGAESEAMANFAEQNKILYVMYGAINNAEKRSFTLSATVSYRDLTIPIINLVTKVLKPKTVGYLCTDLSDSRERVPIYKAGFEPAGTETVYEQYVTLGTADLSSYLTQMKYKNPDLLIIDSGNNEFLMTIAQQVMELGGWGNTKVITLAPGEFARSRAGAQGWYVTAMWAKGLTHPGALKFENDFKAAVGGTPMATQVYYYNAIWTAIEAIKLAGTDTDREKIANLARFSGKLEWETPMGRAHYTAESLGYPQLTPTMCQIIDKVMTRVEIPE